MSSTSNLTTADRKYVTFEGSFILRLYGCRYISSQSISWSLNRLGFPGIAGPPEEWEGGGSDQTAAISSIHNDSDTDGFFDFPQIFTDILIRQALVWEEEVIGFCEAASAVRITAAIGDIGSHLSAHG